MGFCNFGPAVAGSAGPVPPALCVRSYVRTYIHPVLICMYVSLYGTAQVQCRTRSSVLCSNLDYSLRLSLAMLTRNLQVSRLNSLELSAGRVV